MLTIVALIPVIMLLSLGILRILALLVLSFWGVGVATLLTESPVDFKNVHHVCKSVIGMKRKTLHKF